jgi:ribonuclease P protein component
MGEGLHYTFSKSERLTNVKLIESVFISTDNVKAFPLLFVYRSFDLEGSSPFQVLFSVSKKKFKHAVDRNRIKRLMRESFRLQKHAFMEALGEKRLIGAFIYTHKDICDYKRISQAMAKLIEQLKGSLNPAINSKS